MGSATPTKARGGRVLGCNGISGVSPEFFGVSPDKPCRCKETGLVRNGPTGLRDRVGMTVHTPCATYKEICINLLVSTRIAACRYPDESVSQYCVTYLPGQSVAYFPSLYPIGCRLQVELFQQLLQGQVVVGCNVFEDA